MFGRLRVGPIVDAIRHLLVRSASSNGPSLVLSGRCVGCGPGVVVHHVA